MQQQQQQQHQRRGRSQLDISAHDDSFSSAGVGTRMERERMVSGCSGQEGGWMLNSGGYSEQRRLSTT